MNITKANGKNEYELIKNLKKRSGQTDEKIVEAVTTIINSVKEQGDDAVREFTVKIWTVWYLKRPLLKRTNLILILMRLTMTLKCHNQG